MSDNKPIVGTSRDGDFVHAGQEMASNEGFNSVSKLWYDQTISIGDGIGQVLDERRERQDIVGPIKDWGVGINEHNELIFEYVDGREFRATDHALKQVANWSDSISHSFVKRMTNDVYKPNGKLDYKRDRGDAETLAMVFRNGKRHIDQDKIFKMRTYTDGTLRAMLSEKYAEINNVWYLEILQDLLPEARLSHWRGDADTIFGNVLIPDTIRQDDDSDYGGMLSISNCEVGKRRLGQLPSVFRAICMNGCIWGQEKGNSINKKHMGEINLVELRDKIVKNIDQQIPLLPTIVAQFMQTRELELQTGDNLGALLLAVADKYKLTTGSPNSQLHAVANEYQAHEANHKNLFGVINAVTRAGQDKRYTNDTWYKFDEIGGKLMSSSESDWNALRRKANAYTVKDIHKAYALSS